MNQGEDVIVPLTDAEGYTLEERRYQDARRRSRFARFLEATVEVVLTVVGVFALVGLFILLLFASLAPTPTRSRRWPS